MSGGASLGLALGYSGGRGYCAGARVPARSAPEVIRRAEGGRLGLDRRKGASGGGKGEGVRGFSLLKI